MSLVDMYFAVNPSRVIERHFGVSLDCEDGLEKQKNTMLIARIRRKKRIVEKYSKIATRESKRHIVKQNDFVFLV